MRQELFINGTPVPLKEDISIAATYAIADIREPDKRQGDITRTIRLPGSTAINTMLGHIFEINIDGSFNPNIKASALLLVDSIPVLQGSMQLTAINATGTDRNLGHIEYECIIYTGASDIYSSCGDAELTDLDLSIYNHNSLDRALQWNSSGDSIVVSGVTTAYALGTGYVYPLIEYGGSSSRPDIATPMFHAIDLLPAIYVKTYLDKIFEVAGFRYSSTFLNSTLFKSLIIPATGGGRPPLRSITLSAELLLTNLSGSEVCTYKAYYRVRVSLVTEMRLSVLEGTIGAGASDTLSFDTLTLNVGAGWQVGLVVEFSYPTPPPINTLRVNADTFIQGWYDNDEDDPDSFRAERAGVEYLNYNNGWNSIILLTVVYGSFSTDNHISPADAINDFIPFNIRQRDLMTAIIRMFNLYVMPDREDPKLLIIEPYISWFTGLQVDWTQRQAMDKGIEIIPLGELTDKSYLFSYMEDSDYWNTFYHDGWEEVYGQERLVVDNDFLKSEKEMRLPFAPTPSRVLPRGLVVPSIVKDRPLNPPSENHYNSKPRILYFGGRIALTAGNWTHKDANGQTNRATYPYAGHFDHPTAPTFDLNFGRCRELYFGSVTGLAYTNNNLFGKYYSPFFEEITHKDARLIKAWFYLKPLDIAQLDFRKYFYFDKYLCRLNAVIDYDCTGSSLTLVELVKVQQAGAFVPTTTNIRRYTLPLNPLEGYTEMKSEVGSGAMLALNTSPEVLIEDPSEGQALVIQDVLFWMTEMTTPYAGNTTLALRYTGGTTDLYTESNAMPATSNNQVYKGCAVCSGGSAVLVNTGVELYTKTGDATGGDGTLNVLVIYKIVKLNDLAFEE